ncbi:MAG TPA: hypothetical protein VGT03_13230 [Candidatus Acidoferrales bacterium]|nr:hypothetical protein [Candidatus Acidoferrales bacterium]
MKRRTYIVIIVLAILVAFAVREIRQHKKLALGEAFVGGQGVTVWNSPAPVRAPVTTLGYGSPVQITDRYGDFAEIRDASGVQGWVSSRSLLAPAVWREASALDERTKSMPVEAHGETRVRTNFHTEPGRTTPVLLEAPGGVPVILLERKPVPLESQPTKGNEPAPARMEDWWLVRARTKDAGEISGWILGRFVNLDLPDPLAGYASSESINVMAWYEINQALDSNGRSKPEYLMAGTRGGEGQPCDFTLIRVYTWSLARSRYETAFIENDLCGSLPIDVTRAGAPGGAGFFRFRNAGPGGTENREYGMKFTIVRRVGGKTSPRKGRRR